MDVKNLLTFFFFITLILVFFSAFKRWHAHNIMSSLEVDVVDELGEGLLQPVPQEAQ